MDINMNIDFNLLAKKVLMDIFEELDVHYSFINSSTIVINSNVEEIKLNMLNEKLNSYGIKVITNPKEKIIQKIKEILNDLLQSDYEKFNLNTSCYLSEKIGYSYGYLSTLFSELTHLTIENYFILQKIELIKKFLNTQELTISEIAYRLKYSSAAHLSNQFRKTTGLSPSSFKKIINKKMNFSKDILLSEKSYC